MVDREVALGWTLGSCKFPIRRTRLRSQYSNPRARTLVVAELVRPEPTGYGKRRFSSRVWFPRSVAWLTITLVILTSIAWMSVRRTLARWEMIALISVVPAVCCGIAAASVQGETAQLSLLIVPVVWSGLLYSKEVGFSAWVSSTAVFTWVQANGSVELSKTISDVAARQGIEHHLT